MTPAPPIRVVVTAADIRDGLPADAHLNPIARALARATQGRKASVHGDLAFLKGRRPDRRGETLTSYRLPQRAWRWLAAFDRGEPVAPIRFTLEKGTAWS